MFNSLHKLTNGFIRRRSNDTNKTEKQVNNLPGPTVSKKPSDKQMPSVFQRLSNLTRNTFRTSNKATDAICRPANNFPGPSLSKKASGQTSLFKRLSNTTRNMFLKSNKVDPQIPNANGPRNEKPIKDQLLVKQKTVLKGKVSDKQKIDLLPAKEQTIIQKKKDPLPIKQAKKNAFIKQENVPKKQAKEIVPRGWESVHKKRDPSPTKQAKEIVPRGLETVQKKRDPSPTKEAKKIVPRGQEIVQKKRDPSPTKEAKKIVPKGREIVQKKRDPSPTKQEKEIVPRGQEIVQKKRDPSPTKEAKKIVPKGREIVQKKRDPSPTKQEKEIVPRGREIVQKKRDLSPTKQAKEIKPRARETVQKKRDPLPAKQPEQIVKTVQHKRDPSPVKQTKPIIIREQRTVQPKKDLSPTKDANVNMAKQKVTVQQKRDSVPAKKIDTKPNQAAGQVALQKKIDPSPLKQIKGKGSMVPVENDLPVNEQQNNIQKVQGAVRRIEVLPWKEPDILTNQKRTENERKVLLPEEQKKVIQNDRQNSVKQNKDKKPEMQENNLKVQFAEPVIVTLAKLQISLKQPEVEKSVKKNCLISIEDFRLGRMLGKGSFGRVFLALHKPSKRNFAIKALSKTRVYYGSMTKSVMLEKKILKLATEAKNPFVIGLFAAFQTEHHLCFATEYLAGGDLHSAIQTKLSKEHIVFYAACIVNGLQFLHKNKFVHRDIKPENVLLDKRGYARIADFGLCKEEISCNSAISGRCGTTHFMAPEIFSQPYYTQAVDWWALGVTIYEMATGDLPFDSEDKKFMVSKIVYGEPYYPADLPAETRSIIEALLEKSPVLRLGSGKSGAEDVKSHPFFKKINWQALMNKQVKPPPAPKVFSKPSATKPILTENKFEKPITEAIQETFKEFDEVPCSGKK